MGHEIKCHEVQERAYVICDRLCTLCVGNNIEYEMHFLIECPFYDNIRYSLFNKCMFIYNDFY